MNFYTKVEVTDKPGAKLAVGSLSAYQNRTGNYSLSEIICLVLDVKYSYWF